MSQRGRDLAVPVGALVVTVIGGIVGGFVLPDEVAIRYSVEPGWPTAATVVPRWLDAVLWPVITAVLVVAAGMASRRLRARAAVRDLLGAISGTALVVVGIRVVVLVAGWGALDSTASRPPHLLAYMWLLLACLGLGWGSAWLASRTRPLGPPPLVLPATPGHDGVVWVGRARLGALARWLAVLPPLVVVPPVVMALPGAPMWGYVAASCLLGGLSLRHATVDVTIGPGGIRVRTRPLGTTIDVAWEDVTSVVAVDVDLRSHRPVQTVVRRHVLLRPGPALRITGRDAPLLVSVDDAPTGAAVAQRHLSTHRAVAAQAG